MYQTLFLSPELAKRWRWRQSLEQYSWPLRMILLGASTKNMEISGPVHHLLIWGSIGLQKACALVGFCALSFLIKALSCQEGLQFFWQSLSSNGQVFDSGLQYEKTPCCQITKECSLKLYQWLSSQAEKKAAIYKNSVSEILNITRGLEYIIKQGNAKLKISMTAH